MIKEEDLVGGITKALASTFADEYSISVKRFKGMTSLGLRTHLHNCTPEALATHVKQRIDSFAKGYAQEQRKLFERIPKLGGNFITFVIYFYHRDVIVHEMSVSTIFSRADLEALLPTRMLPTKQKAVPGPNKV